MIFLWYLYGIDRVFVSRVLCDRVRISMVLTECICIRLCIWVYLYLHLSVPLYFPGVVWQSAHQYGIDRVDAITGTRVPPSNTLPTLQHFVPLLFSSINIIFVSIIFTITIYLMIFNVSCWCLLLKACWRLVVFIAQLVNCSTLRFFVTLTILGKS